MKNRNLLLGAIVVSGSAYLLAMATGHMTMRWILKPGTIVLIIALALTMRDAAKTYRNLIVAGLALSAVGDCFLLMSGSKWFTYGVFTFLLAHLVYIAAFATRWRGISRSQWIAAAPVALYSYWLLDGLHQGLYSKGNAGLWLPLLIYVIVISCMIWGAVISGSRIAAAGAVLFFLSDSLLAWNKFVSPIPAAGYGVMITYYAAQFLIARSIIDNRQTKAGGSHAGISRAL